MVGAAADAWYDYLTFPIAPLVLLVQLVAVFLPSRPWRWALGLGCPLAIVAMFLYVDTVPVKAEGVNLGAAVFVLWLMASAVLLIAAVLLELVRHSRAPRFVDE